MAVGLGVLKLRPIDFWRMTPVELDAALRGAFGEQMSVGQPDRSSLEALIEEFPDNGRK